MGKTAPGAVALQIRALREARYGRSQAEMRAPREAAKNADRKRMLGKVAKPKKAPQ